MKPGRLALSFVAGGLVVLAMLVVGVGMFYDRGDPLAPLDTVEIEYLTPEEAARLLGEDPDRRRLPAMPVAQPATATERPDGEDTD